MLKGRVGDDSLAGQLWILRHPPQAKSTSPPIRNYAANWTAEISRSTAALRVASNARTLKASNSASPKATTNPPA
jgi:hypothetical protein